MNAKRALLLSLLALISLPPALLAWGDNGHRIVGEIAQSRLSPEARDAIGAYAGSTRLAQVSTWPDFIRSDRRWSFVNTWHYVTVEDDNELRAVLTRAAESETPDNAVEAIEFFERLLAGDAAVRSHFGELVEEAGVDLLFDSLDATALAFLVHIIGDLHQPLHVGRGGDRGGNSIMVEWFDEPMRLHALWDSGLIDRESLSFTEFTQFIEQEFESRGGEWSGARPVEWALESRALRSDVYEIWNRTDRESHLPELGYRYSYDHIGTVKQRLFQAGVRLAEVLNAAYAD